MQSPEDVNSSLIRAVRAGNLERARDLINSYGLSYSKAWSNGYVLLCDALKNGHGAVAKLLLRSGSKVNSRNIKINPCDSALHLAAAYGDTEIVQMILDRGADTGVKNQFGKTPLHTAIESKKVENVQLLLNHGFNVNATANDGISLLHAAARIGCLQTVEHLLKNGAYVNCVCTSLWRKMYTPLHFAVESGNTGVVTLLLSRGANVDDEAADSITPLHIAAKKGYGCIAEELLKYDACIHSVTSREGNTPLHFAAKMGRKAVVKILLQHGAKVDDQDKDGKTTLYLAVKKGSLTIVEDLLMYRPDINNKINQSCLRTAVQGHRETHAKIVEAILEYGIIVNPEDANDPELLHTAVEKGYLTIVEDLLKYGANVNMLHDSRFKGLKPLHSAAKNKQEEVAELLISYEADINARDKSGQTPIFYAIENADIKITKLLLTNRANVKDSPELLNIAVEKKCIEIVEALLQHDVDVNASNRYGQTALHFTAFSANERLSVFRTNQDRDHAIRGEIAKLLLSKGANVNSQDTNGATTLHGATHKGYTKVVEALLEYNANVNSVGDDGSTSLLLSAQKGHEEISTMLFNKGADVNAEQNEFTALHLAIQNGHTGTVKLLLECGAKVDSKSKNDITPLLVCAKRGNEEISAMLLNKGADVNAKQKDKFTALHLAIQNRHKGIAKLLLECGAKVDSKIKNDITPLHMGAEYGDREIIETLLKHGADINCRDKDGRTALHIASHQGYTKVVENLLEYGSDINITSRDNCTPLDHAIARIKSFGRRFHAFDSDDSDDYYDDEDYDYDVRRINPFEDTAEVLARHLVKMKTAHLYVSEQNLLSLCGKYKMNNFRDECEKEIAGMKSEKINDANISFHDILAKRTSSLAIYMRNENIVQALKSDDYITKFPIYASMIASHFRKSMERKELLDQGYNILHFLFPELPYDCTEKIFSYLSDEDLRILIDACKPLAISNPDTNIDDVVITSNVSQVQYA